MRKMQEFDKVASMEELEQVSGGNYKEYVQVSDAIAKCISQINNSTYDDKTERLTQDETAKWLKDNLKIGVDFGISLGFRPLDGVLNKSARYYSLDGVKTGMKYTHAEVLKMIGNWKG